MYKTIRHGENSLQYTILPQNDDFRIEGKLSSAGSSGSSASGRKSKAKRPRRRSFFAYLGLIFVCTVIVGALLIPFLVSAERFPSPTEWFTKTRAALIKSNVRAGGDGAGGGGGGGGGVSGNGVNVGKIIKIINKDGAARAVWGGNQTGVGGNPPAAGGNPTAPNTQAYPSSNSTSNSRKDSAETEAVTTIVAAERNVNGNAPAESKVDQQPEMPADGIQIESHLVGADGGEDDQPLEPTPQTQGHFVTEVRFESPKSNDGDDSHLSAIVPTIVVTTLRISDPSSPLTAKTQTSPPPMVRPTSSLSSSNVNAPRLPVGNNGGFGAQPAPPAMPTIMTRIIQVPLLKSASKKPKKPPLLAKTNSQVVSGPGQDDVVGPAPAVDNSHQSSAAGGSVLTQNANIKTANANWINSHWPYIDPSTYFQWTGYKAEDSVLLPALLGFALIGMILIITVCLVARNKRTIVSSVRKRNRHDIEETGAEDNATLLTTTNLSDED